MNRSIVRKNRLRVLKDTRNFYYGPDWEDLGNRSVNKDSEECFYNSADGRRCAVSRLIPEITDEEFNGIVPGGTKNWFPDKQDKFNDLVLDYATKNDLHSDDAHETLKWFRRLQEVHDFDNPSGYYELCKDAC
jgi:hypothetical protein